MPEKVGIVAVAICCQALYQVILAKGGAIYAEIRESTLPIHITLKSINMHTILAAAFCTLHLLSPTPPVNEPASGTHSLNNMPESPPVGNGTRPS
ncbi:hypothetical protein AAKU55_000309 [Oxalobacteraceae bacterium GrIS 1.11]